LFHEKCILMYELRILIYKLLIRFLLGEEGQSEILVSSNQRADRRLHTANYLLHSRQNNPGKTAWTAFYEFIKQYTRDGKRQLRQERYLDRPQ
jgi:hypothetical protein